MSNFKTKYFLLILVAFGILLFAGFSGTFPDQPKSGFRAMEGNLVTHYFEDKTDSLSGPELYELRNENGLPIWFGRHIFKDVCMTGECKMIRLWLFWDGAGNYLGMEIPENEPLTKSDHTEFEAADYAKLEDILRDTASILKKLSSDDLIIVPDSIDPFKAYEVDGYTAATQPALSEVVVKDAVYTCHTLWHTVYGPTRRAVSDILDEKISADYLSLLFQSENPALMAWAVSGVEKSPDLHEAFYPLVLSVISSEHSSLPDQALNYFIPSRLSGFDEQMNLAKIIPEVGVQKKYDIIWKLVETGNVHELVVLQLLQYFDNQEIGVGSLNLIYRLVLPEYISRNDEVRELLQKLSSHENAYIRNLTMKVLNRD
jgi:hypothetical protein